LPPCAIAFALDISDSRRDARYGLRLLVNRIIEEHSKNGDLLHISHKLLRTGGEAIVRRPDRANEAQILINWTFDPKASALVFANPL
jgi:hypothetical protein